MPCTKGKKSRSIVAVSKLPAGSGWYPQPSTQFGYRVDLSLPAGQRALVAGRLTSEALPADTSGRYRAREAYATSVETSVYVADGWTGRGIGSSLYEFLFASLVEEDLHRAYAGITLPNPVSVALHRRFGFEHVGTFREQGRKFDRYWDVAWFEKAL